MQIMKSNMYESNYLTAGPDRWQNSERIQAVREITTQTCRSNGSYEYKIQPQWYGKQGRKWHFAQQMVHWNKCTYIRWPLPVITYTIMRAGPNARAASPWGKTAPIARPSDEAAQPSRHKTPVNTPLLLLRWLWAWSTWSRIVTPWERKVDSTMKVGNSMKMRGAHVREHNNISIIKSKRWRWDGHNMKPAQTQPQQEHQ